MNNPRPQLNKAWTDRIESAKKSLRSLNKVATSETREASKLLAAIMPLRVKKAPAEPVRDTFPFEIIVVTDDLFDNQSER